MAMIQPDELRTQQPCGSHGSRGCDVWDAICAADRGDVAALQRLLEQDPSIARYSQPIHFAACGGHRAAVQVLLDSGADPEAEFNGSDPVTAARDRRHEEVARLLEDARLHRGRARPTVADHAIHDAAATGDIARIIELLDAEPGLINLSDRSGSTPLHRAVAASALEAASLLLDRGADIHALHGAGARSERGYAAVDFQPIDLALWDGPFWGIQGDFAMAQLLLSRGSAHDLVIASALGEIELARDILDRDPAQIAHARPSGKRALSSAVEFGHHDIVKLLLDRGADPRWPDGTNAPQGVALHAAARVGDTQLVEWLLTAGANPNAHLNSAGSATYVARTPELRALLTKHGGELDPYDLVWLGDHDAAVRKVATDSSSSHAGCGGVLAAAATMGKRDLLIRLLEAGARVAPVVNDCRTYLFTDPDMLRLLLESGMDPNLPSWLHTTPLHDLCTRDNRGRPRENRLECAAILLDAGAAISARDDDYRSTPLAWAARHNVPDMVEFLLARRAPMSLPDDDPWATPLAWATRRGHDRIVAILRAAGATDSDG